MRLLENTVIDSVKPIDICKKRANVNAMRSATKKQGDMSKAIQKLMV